MGPNFHALQLIAEIALGILGFSAILIGLSRTSDGFSAPDNFRIQLLTYSAIGAMFCALIPFAVFGDNQENSWLIVSWLLCLYSILGLFIFPRRVSKFRRLFGFISFTFSYHSNGNACFELYYFRSDDN